MSLREGVLYCFISLVICIRFMGQVHHSSPLTTTQVKNWARWANSREKQSVHPQQREGRQLPVCSDQQAVNKIVIRAGGWRGIIWRSRLGNRPVRGHQPSCRPCCLCLLVLLKRSKSNNFSNLLKTSLDLLQGFRIPLLLRPAAKRWLLFRAPFTRPAKISSRLAVAFLQNRCTRNQPESSNELIPRNSYYM